MEKKQKIWEYLYTEWVKPIGIGILIVVLLNSFVCQVYKVDGSSMYPTLVDKEKMFTTKYDYRFGEMEREDIVILRVNMEESGRINLVKRVIAVEGDTIELKDGVLYINGEEKEEPYLEDSRKEAEKNYPNQPFNEDIPKLTIPKDQIFVMGDNRPGSSDSRYFGFVNEEMVKAKVKAVIWPLDKMRVIEH